MRMLERCSQLNLTLEPFAVDASGHFRGQDFDHDLAAESDVVSEEDPAHAGIAKLVPQPVAFAEVGLQAIAQIDHQMMIGLSNTPRNTPATSEAPPRFGSTRLVFDTYHIVNERDLRERVAKLAGLHGNAPWLKIHPRQVERLGIPCLDLGRKTKRYLRTDVSAWLESKRRGGQYRGQ
jgi:hypothetical protein